MTDHDDKPHQLPPPPDLFPVNDKQRLELQASAKGAALGLTISIKPRPDHPADVLPFKPAEPEKD